MCYSAEASFIASGVLTATSLSIARLPKVKASLPLAYLPAIFAAHQFIEGIIWLNQGKIEIEALEAPAVFLYVLIAFVFWPIYIPYTAYRMETEKRRRVLILICQAIGLGVGLSYLLGMLRSPVGVSVYSCNLAYQVQPLWELGAGYIFAVTVPFFVSSHRGLVLFGIAVLFSYAAGMYLAKMPAFPSVWCFFAAFLSASLYVYFRAAQRTTIPNPEVRAVLGH